MTLLQLFREALTLMVGTTSRSASTAITSQRMVKTVLALMIRRRQDLAQMFTTQLINSRHLHTKLTMLLDWWNKALLQLTIKFLRTSAFWKVIMRLRSALCNLQAIFMMQHQSNRTRGAETNTKAQALSASACMTAPFRR